MIQRTICLLSDNWVFRRARSFLGAGKGWQGCLFITSGSTGYAFVGVDERIDTSTPAGEHGEDGGLMAECERDAIKARV